MGSGSVEYCAGGGGASLFGAGGDGCYDDSNDHLGYQGGVGAGGGSAAGNGLRAYGGEGYVEI